MYAEKEREEKRKLLAMQPKRESSRIMRKRREQEHRDKELAEKVSSSLTQAYFLDVFRVFREKALKKFFSALSFFGPEFFFQMSKKKPA